MEWFVTLKNYDSKDKYCREILIILAREKVIH